MAEKKITDPEDRNNPNQRSQRRNEIEEQSLGELWNSGKLCLNISLMGIIKEEKRKGQKNI